MHKAKPFDIPKQLVWEAYHRVKANQGAAGMDGKSLADFERDLKDNLYKLWNRMSSGSYMPPPVRRVSIPKKGGGTRPLGIPTVADRIGQPVVKMLLEPQLDKMFHRDSYGYRPGKSAHQALDEVRKRCWRYDWAVDLDIKGYFDSIDRSKLQEVFRHRVRDGVLRRLVGKWLNAGVMEDGRLTKPEAGVPQGGVVSPLLSNVYLHEVLDSWFEETVKPRLKGRAFLVRFADDAVLAFEREDDADRFMAVLAKRFAKYGLRLHPEKTRLLCFERPKSGGKSQGKLGTFTFLGFTHFWAISRKGYWVIKRKTAKDGFTRSLKVLSEWLRAVRHWPIRMQHRVLCAKLRGHFQYFGIRGNHEALSRLLYNVHRLWKKWLGRRSHKARRNWEWFNNLLRRFPLPSPRVVHAC